MKPAGRATPFEMLCWGFTVARGRKDMMAGEIATSGRESRVSACWIRRSRIKRWLQVF